LIYFMQCSAGGPVKIGFTDDVQLRQQQLEASYGRPLALLATMEGGRAEEASIHRRFRQLRLGRTEQFRPGRELMEFIGRPLLVGANPDAVEAMEVERATRPVRLDLTIEDHERLERCAKRYGISKSSYVRMKLFKGMESDEIKGGPK
jgi:hypothetical protein